MTEEIEPEELHAMWVAYVSNDRTDEILRDRLAAYYWPSVKKFAARHAAKSLASRDDLESWAAAGLLRALSRYDPIPREGYPVPVSFPLFLNRSMLSLMLDGLRKEDFAPRSLRKRQRDLETVRQRLTQELGRAPHDYEAAVALGWSVEEVNKTDFEVKNSWIDYIEDNAAASDHLASMAAPEDHDDDGLAVTIRLAFAEEVQRLAPLPRTVMALVYFEELSIGAAAEAIGIPEAQLKSVHQQAVAQCHEAVMAVIGVVQLPL